MIFKFSFRFKLTEGIGLCKLEFFSAILGAAISTKYKQMNVELMRSKKLSDTIINLKKRLFNI